jgi:hypothetical protein
LVAGRIFGAAAETKPMARSTGDLAANHPDAYAEHFGCPEGEDPDPWDLDDYPKEIPVTDEEINAMARDHYGVD